MRARTRAAVLAGKLARQATRSAGRGGTAVPGLLAERVAPEIVPQLAAELETSVLVTGTNGKTTTARMLAGILADDGRPLVHNRAGSNLIRGIAAALVEAAGPLGGLPAGSTGVFETDEATIPRAAALIRPRALVITNLMRDQLDRYGEIEAVRGRWVEAIRALDRSSVLVLNADDPSVATLAEHAPGPVVLFGIEDADAALPAGADAEHAVDALWDTTSGADFIYERRFYAHLGHWHCPGVGRRRPTPGFAARAIDSNDPDAISFDLAEGQDALHALRVRLPLVGLYNVYNALAATAAARVLEVPFDVATAALRRVEPAFGRQEELVVDGHTVRVLLGKNPAGMNEALRTLQRSGAGSPLHLLVLLNDRIADGTDVSWIWDTDWESLGSLTQSVAVGGTRSADMALRLAYAGFPAPHVPSDDEGIGATLEAALDRLPAGEPLVVLPTYTALLEVRERLGRRAGARGIWEGA